MRFGASNFIFVLVLAFLAIASIWIVTAELDEVVRAEAVVEPEGQVRTVQARYSGVVETMRVQVGERVVAGDPLLTLASYEARASLEKNRLGLDALYAEILRLRAETTFAENIAWDVNVSDVARLEQAQLFVSRRQRLTQQLRGVEDEIRGLKNRQVELDSVARGASEMLVLKQEEVQMVEPLVQAGIEPSIRLLTVNQELQTLRYELEQSRIRLAGIEIELERLDQKRDELVTEYQTEAQEALVSRESEFRQLQAETEALRERVESTVLRAPITGTVTKVFPSGEGVVVGPAEPLVELIPATQNIQVKANVRPQDISSVSVGQEARVGLSAYDYTVYGVLMGEVSRIAQNTTQSDAGEVFYEVTIVTASLQLSKSNLTPDIMPGMLASVDIAGGKRTVLDYVLKPMRETASKALTEN